MSIGVEELPIQSSSSSIYLPTEGKELKTFITILWSLVSLEMDRLLFMDISHFLHSLCRLFLRHGNLSNLTTPSDQSPLKRVLNYSASAFRPFVSLQVPSAASEEWRMKDEPLSLSICAQRHQVTVQEQQHRGRNSNAPRKWGSHILIK